MFNSFLSKGDFCRLLIIFANSLDSYHDPQKVCPDLDPNFLKKKSADDNISMKIFPAHEELNIRLTLD